MSYKVSRGKLKRQDAAPTMSRADFCKLSTSGVMNLAIIRRSDVPSIMRGVAAGHRDSVMAAKLLTDWAARADDPLCLTCDHEFSRPTEAELVCVLCPPSGSGAMAGGVCLACSTKPDLMQRIHAVFDRLPLGACYRMSGEKLLAIKDAVLVHGIVQWPTVDRYHAWLELADGSIWDNTPAQLDLDQRWVAGDDDSIFQHDGRIWTADDWQARCRPVILARYTLEQATELRAQRDNWGPWRDE